MTAEISRDPWATLDELLGVEVIDTDEGGIGPVAFYGRCSTEDNQDPETSHGWQHGNARKFIEPLGGEIVADYFDVGLSRSVPWERREHSARMLAALKNPNRGWDAIVVGEGTRCWFGNQFSLIAPRLAAYGVDVWVPELGGKYEPRNPLHKMLMSVLGGMSESERQHVQARVRAAMDAQVVNEGRHQGGRAPYGYVVVDGGTHPNPRKAAEGYRLRVLALDEASAEVVRRIFRDYLAGRGDRAIAKGLNRDGVPCPSARRPDQNRHRLADGWQGSTVRSILENPRYTGFAFFGRWTKQETLLDPDDVAAGHVVRFRRASPDQVVRSRKPAHPAIVTVEDFTEAQLLRRSKAAGGLRTARKTERSERPTKRTYLFRGLIRCAICGRKMEASPRKHGMYYRCPARTLTPGSPALESHPPAVYLREDPIRDAVNGWLGRLFDPANVDRTVAALVGAQDGPRSGSSARDAARRRVADAEARISRFQAAVAAGVDPAAMVEAINEAQAERAAARAELENTNDSETVTDAEIYAMIDSLGDVGAALSGAKHDRLAALYKAVDLQVRYQADENAAEVEIRPASRVNSVRVRGGTRTHVRRISPSHVPLGREQQIYPGFQYGAWNVADLIRSTQCRSTVTTQCVSGSTVGAGLVPSLSSGAGCTGGLSSGGALSSAQGIDWGRPVGASDRAEKSIQASDRGPGDVAREKASLASAVECHGTARKRDLGESAVCTARAMPTKLSVAPGILLTSAAIVCGRRSSVAPAAWEEPIEGGTSCREGRSEIAMECIADTERDQYLLGQVRGAFGRVVYSHKTHEKQADLCFRKNRWQQGALVVFTAISTGTFLASLLGTFVSPRMASLATSFIALVVTALSLAAKTFKFGEESGAHRDIASRLWDVRESYLSLIADLMAGVIPASEARARRDELQETTRAAYSDAPRTTSKAYGKAKAGLKDNEEMTLTTREIALFLPEALRLNETQA